jgi:hypothetical protein
MHITYRVRTTSEHGEGRVLDLELALCRNTGVLEVGSHERGAHMLLVPEHVSYDVMSTFVRLTM